MKNKDLGERIYKLIKTDLMLGNIRCDEMFNEQTLADKYGCSRTPVREAAARLAYEGFLSKYPSKGYIIRVPSETEVRQLRECRYILECSVIDKIIAEATDEQIKNLEHIPEDSSENILYINNLVFHMEMVRLTGNGKLAEMIESLLHQLVRPLISGRYPSFSEYAANVREAGGSLTPGHRAIVAALLERDAKKAKKLLKEDIYPSQY